MSLESRFRHIVAAFGQPLWIRNPLWAWMTSAERAGVMSWETVRAHVAHRWGRDDWSEKLSHEERCKLLRMYLATSYIELPHVGRHPVDADSQ